MKISKNINAIMIVTWIIFSCLMMQYVEMIIKPDYWVKAPIKLVLFLVVPVCYIKFNTHTDFSQIIRPVKAKDMGIALMLSFTCYVSVIIGFLGIRPFLDEAQIVRLLGGGPGVSAANFVPIALYIAFVNSFIEEFFFRGFGFLVLRRHLNPIAATVISGMCFSLYHIGIIEGWFNIVLFILAVLGLALVGMFFNFLDRDKYSIFPSWTVHLVSNLAINTVGLILFGVIKI